MNETIFKSILRPRICESLPKPSERERDIACWLIDRGAKIDPETTRQLKR